MLLEGETIELRVTKDDLPSFLACLGIGTLYAIRTGFLPPEAGIWTLGVPRMWEHFTQKPDVPEEIIQVFQASDELSAIQKLMPNEFDSEVDKMINQLQTELGKMSSPIWQAEWKMDQ